MTNAIFAVQIIQGIIPKHLQHRQEIVTVSLKNCQNRSNMALKLHIFG